MRLTRRNTLAVLLVLVAAGGVVGTGAFSTVSADRSISVDSAGDTGANVQFSVNTDAEGLANSGGASDTIGLDFSGLNKNANTTYDNALEISPQGSGNYDISVVDSSLPSHVDINVKNGNSVSAGTSVNASVSIDLKGTAKASNIGSSETIEILVERP